MRIRITGQTFAYKEQLREMGGRWRDNAWEFGHASKEDIEKLKKLPKCLVTEIKEKYDFTPDDEIPDYSLNKLAELVEDKQLDSNYDTIIHGDDKTYFNYFMNQNPQVYFGFSSLGELVRYVEKIPEYCKTGERGEGYSKTNPRWSGTQNMQDALDLAENGWKEGIEESNKILELLNVENATEKRRKYSVAGSQVNVGKMLSGNPIHMISRKNMKGSKRITLFVNVSCSARINAENMRIKAIAVAAMIDILENNGYSCEIVSTVMLNNYIGKSACQMATIIKHAGEKLNLSDIIFTLGHPAFFRRLEFALIGSCDELSNIFEGFGYPAEAFNSNYKPTKNEYYIPVLKNNIVSDNMLEAVKKMIKLIKPEGLNIELRE